MLITIIVISGLLSAIINTDPFNFNKLDKVEQLFN